LPREIVIGADANFEQEQEMRKVFIRYQAKPERVAENRALITDVFAELATAQPEDLRYAALELDDGVFVHFAMSPDDPDVNPLRKIAAFQAFTANAGDRHLVKATQQQMRIIGNYRMLTGTE
jgi:hypothetical protein